jgi:hypothetical protein
LIQDETIGHQLPQIFNLQILEPVLLFDTVKMPVTAVAWNHEHAGAGSFDLVELFSGIKSALVIVAVYQGTAAAAAADLIHAIGVKVHPVLHALIQNPARFLKIAVAKSLLSSAAPIARIMKCRQNIKPGVIKFDTPRFDVPDQQIKNRYKLKFIECFRKIFFKTRPGR